MLARTINGYGLGEGGECKTSPTSKEHDECDFVFLTLRPSYSGRYSRRHLIPAADDSTCCSTCARARVSAATCRPDGRVERCSSESSAFEEFYKGTEWRKASTTMVCS